MAEPTATEIARIGIIREQNKLIAAAYAALLDARAYVLLTPVTPSMGECAGKICGAVNLIEDWKQKREPEV